jgi:hypothetical protein
LSFAAFLLPKPIVQSVTSERDPKVRIQLPKSAQYVGADRWVLYGIADCELHAFVDADRQKNVQRLYWVQFEGYLPTKPELKHKYDYQHIARIHRRRIAPHRGNEGRF